MAIGGVNYASSVTVNGFLCRNCADVDLAAKHIDPTHPRSGRDNTNAASDPTRLAAQKQKLADAKAAADEMKRQVTHYAPGGAVAGTLLAGSVIDRAA